LSVSQYLVFLKNKTKLGFILIKGQTTNNETHGTSNWSTWIDFLDALSAISFV